MNFVKKKINARDYYLNFEETNTFSRFNMTGCKQYLRKYFLTSSAEPFNVIHLTFCCVSVIITELKNNYQMYCTKIASGKMRQLRSLPKICGGYIRKHIVHE